MKFNNLVSKLLKEANFGRKEFYHGADKSHIQSFISGIKPEMAGTNHEGAGKEQGAGFYLFKDKKRALQYVTQDATEFIKDPIIVVIDEELNTDCFDIDYEGEWKLVRNFISNHMQELKSNPAYGIKQSPTAEKLGTAQIWVDNNTTRSFSMTKPFWGDQQRSVAEAFYILFQNIKKINPNLFNKFEDEVMDKASVLKYNGERKIFPARIEDVKGNILWQRGQQQNGQQQPIQ
jgi:hypothetical protein